MDDQPLPALLASMLASIDARGMQVRDPVEWALVRRSWPGGTADRSSPAAAEWVRRWGPAHVSPGAFEACSCSVGRCAVCN